MKPVVTRFSAYQLGTPGSSFSYFAGGHFTMIEGRLTDQSRHTLEYEMKQCGVEIADTLHITSWDKDHCHAGELVNLLDLLQPSRIETPGYEPGSDNGRESRRIVDAYRAGRRNSNRPVTIEAITPSYIDGLEPAQALAFKNSLYHPRYLDAECANNNSTVKFFRSGSFNVLSLGDVENQQISARLRRCDQLKRETDVLILAHHGADNGFTNKSFLERIEPELAICSADYDNQFEHPKQEIRDRLFEQGIRLMTTKTGDILVKSTGDHTGRYKAINFKGGGRREISSETEFVAKKAELLSYNADTQRQLFGRRPQHPTR